MPKDTDDSYSKKEADDRMAAALRGARIAKPTPMESIPPKRTKIATQKRRLMKTKAGKKPGS